MKKKLTILLLVGMLFGCGKKSADKTEYPAKSFSFGTYSDFCAEPCADFYLLEINNLYPYNGGAYKQPLTFKNSAMPSEKYQVAKPLLDSVPSFLTNNPNMTYGCPDCYDQGVIHLELYENGKTYYWRLDRNTDSLPAPIQSYAQRVLTVINEIKK